MKIIYLYHSGFLVELERYVLVFDYCGGGLAGLDREKTVLFFASHKHQDHFQLDIFKYYGRCEKLHYFLGPDIRLNEKYLQRKGLDGKVLLFTTRVRAGQKLSWEDVSIETLRSTDEGVAFLVGVEGKAIYHAGDLNWWYWEEESDTWNDQMERAYKRELEKIRGRRFDAAFVPLDPRLGKGYGLGIETFLKETDACVVFPMHMWEEYGVIRRFLESQEAAPYRDRIMEISYPGQEFIL